MIKVVFFAALREMLKKSEIDWPLTSTVNSLLTELKAQGEPWASALERDDLLCAVNQELCEQNQSLATGDEVAFFPPVTGG